MVSTTRSPTLSRAELSWVSVLGSEYLVDFGIGTQPRFHRVSKEKECNCGSVNCPAVDAVRDYLRAGGQRAPDPLPACPICGAKTIRDPRWNGKYTREIGWRCSVGGVTHFLKQKLTRIYQNYQAHPYLFPPAPGYPGVRRDEVLTYDDLIPVYEKAAAEGYDPAA